MIEDFKFGSIAIIGDLILDRYLHGSVDRLSPEAPVPVLRHSTVTQVPGGAGNVAVNAAALGCAVNLIGVVGQDPEGDALTALLNAVPNISLQGLIADENAQTTTKTRVVSARQQIVRIDQEKHLTLSAQSEDALIEAAIRALENARVFVCSDYAKGVLSERVLREIIAAGRARKIPVIVDPKRETFEAYRGATLITPNCHELRAATGCDTRTDDDVVIAAQKASEQFDGNILVTRSEKGMTLWRHDRVAQHFSTFKSEVFDVSGAGDTVVATVAGVLSAQQPLETAITIATSAAAIAVNKLGTASVSRAELSAALKHNILSHSRTVTREAGKKIVEGWRQNGAKIVFTNGCFDLLHPGHITLLESAARAGDKLVIGLNSDASIRRLKGESRPVQDEKSRALLLGALRCVDLVILFDEDTPLEIIKSIRPDILVKGADYRIDQVVGGEFVKGLGGEVLLVDIVVGRSTTALIARARQSDT